MNVLVTGGAGYIGSHACKKLALAGHRVFVLDDLSRGHSWAVKWGPLLRGGLSDGAFLDHVFRQHKFDCVMHFAAFASVGESVREPLLYYENNVLGSLRLLQAMQRHSVRTLVFSSTCATYGNPVRALDESHPLNPVNPYGHTKLAVEQMIQDFVRSDKIRACSLRYFNAAGADSQGQIGEFHFPETHLIPLCLETVYGGRPITIFGNDYPTPDGTCIRDYVHVSDLAEAHLIAMERLQAKTESCFEVYNLGTGQGHSVLEVIQALEDVTRRKINPVLGPRRPGDPPILVAEASRAKTELGWIPTQSDLNYILVTAAQWYERKKGVELFKT